VAYHGNTGIHFLKGKAYQNMNAATAFFKNSFVRVLVGNVFMLSP